MKGLKRLTAGTVLVFVLAAATYAGETSTPPYASHGATSTPPCSTSQDTTNDSSAAEETEAAITSIPADVVSISGAVFDMLMAL
jgi:hypothetical protein